MGKTICPRHGGIIGILACRHSSTAVWREELRFVVEIRGQIRGQTGLVLCGNGKPFLRCFIRFVRVCENQVNANPVFPKVPVPSDY